MRRTPASPCSANARRWSSNSDWKACSRSRSASSRSPLLLRDRLLAHARGGPLARVRLGELGEPRFQRLDPAARRADARRHVLQQLGARRQLLELAVQPLEAVARGAAPRRRLLDRLRELLGAQGHRLALRAERAPRRLVAVAEEHVDEA